DSEEYLNSEKYELKRWDLNHPDSLRNLLATLNQIRRANPALQRNEHLMFHSIDSDHLLAYSKHTPGASNIVLVVVNLDPHAPRSGHLELPLDHFRLGGSFEVRDLLADQKASWQGSRTFIELDPATRPAHVFQLRR